MQQWSLGLDVLGDGENKIQGEVSQGRSRRWTFWTEMATWMKAPLPQFALNWGGSWDKGSLVLKPETSREGEWSTSIRCSRRMVLDQAGEQAPCQKHWSFSVVAYHQSASLRSQMTKACSSASTPCITHLLKIQLLPWLLRNMAVQASQNSSMMLTFLSKCHRTAKFPLVCLWK